MCCPNITRAAGHPSVARHKDRASGTWSSTPQSSLAQATTSEGVSLNVLEPILTTGARFSWTSSGKGGLSLEVKTRHQPDGNLSDRMRTCWLPVPGPRDDGRRTTRHHRLERRTQAGTVQYHPLPRNAQFRMKISAQASVPPSKRSGPWILIPGPHTPIGDQSLVCYSIIHNDTPINPTNELL